MDQQLSAAQEASSGDSAIRRARPNFAERCPAFCRFTFDLEVAPLKSKPCLTDTSYMTGLPSQYRLLTNAIEFASQNHRVISQNMANINTPNYQAKELSFEQFLEGSRNREAREFNIEYVQGLPSRNDGNNVDMDRELASLKKNALAHQTLTQLLGSQIGIIQRAISG